MTFSLKVIQSFLNRQSSKLRVCRTMSSSANEVAFSVKGKGGFIELNRPQALNALNLNMVRLISCKLDEWKGKMDYVVVRGSGRAFCAGGDIVSVTKDGPQDTCLGEEFFREEYTMNYQISEFPVPYIAIIDGITMGGGVGLSVHGKFRIATENTMFAMPETQIGLFPDVGGSYFLSRMGPLGTYLAMSGTRLKGMDVVKAGVATHFIESKKIPNLLQHIQTSGDSSNICDIITSHTKSVKSHEFSLENKLDLIKVAFSQPTVDGIMEKLKQDGSEWGLLTVKTLSKMSPTSLKITLKQLKEGQRKSLKECLEMEYTLAVNALKATISRDFHEGVRALLVDKDKNPMWKPPTVWDVDDKLVQKVFEAIPCKELTL